MCTVFDAGPYVCSLHKIVWGKLPPPSFLSAEKISRSTAREKRTFMRCLNQFWYFSLHFLLNKLIKILFQENKKGRGISYFQYFFFLFPFALDCLFSLFLGINILPSCRFFHPHLFQNPPSPFSKSSLSCKRLNSIRGRANTARRLHIKFLLHNSA